MDLHHPLQVITPTVDGDVLTVLAGAHARFTAPQVHRLIGEHSESGVRKSLKRLASQGLVTATRAGQAWEYELNRTHLAAGHVESLARLRGALIDGIHDALAAWTTGPEYAALFGTVAVGPMRVDSDIDIFIVRPDGVDPEDDEWRNDLDELISAVASWTGNDAQILEFSSTEVTAALGADSERVLRDIRDEGITLFGHERYLQRATRRS
ncbi:MAG: nucleotidyltransferase domain-containing protein [Acidimicrobiia bacterium]|nr:nucleotidyltransferase domain-containing protein [Acidimicrobiia bacterium]